MKKTSPANKINSADKAQNKEIISREIRLSCSPDEALKLDHQLCFPLYAAARKIVSEYTPYLKPVGITYTQYITFMVLWEHDNISVGDICAKLYLDNGTMTPLLKKMESEGYITRRRDGEDERRVKICLTEKGRSMKEKVSDVPFKIGSCMPISFEDAKTLRRILIALLDS